MDKKINLLEGPIFSTLTRLALPIMGTSLIQMAYNLTDMIWIGKMGAGAVAAVGSAGMYMWLSNGLSTLARMGGQVCLGQAIGSSRQEEAKQYALGTIRLGILFGMIFGIMTLLFYKPMISFFGLTSPEIIQQAEIYLIITCGLVVINFLNQIFTSLMTAMGDSHHPFVATTIGLVLNVVLDPLFIFTFDMGVAGAAIATVIAQVIVLIFMIIFIRKDTYVFANFSLKHKVQKIIYKKILRIGFPVSIQSMTFTFISMVIARFIAGYGDVAIAVQKVGSQIESISWMSAEGFGSALSAFVAQNYGASKIDRVKKGTASAVKVCALWGLFTTAVLILLPQFIFQIFISEKDVIPLGVDYLRILGISQLFMCMELTLAGALNGLGKTFIPSFVSVTLTAIRIPMIILLSATVLGLNGIWWSISLTSILKGIVISVCFIVVIKKFKHKDEHEKQG
ncbi:MAG: MATE family efflux transporter [Coprobacillus sp.]